MWQDISLSFRAQSFPLIHQPFTSAEDLPGGKPSAQRRGAAGEAAAMAPSLLLLLLALLPRVFPLLGKCPQGLCGRRRAENRTGSRRALNQAWPGGWGRWCGKSPCRWRSCGHFNPLGAAWGKPPLEPSLSCLPLLTHTLRCPVSKGAQGGGLLGAHGIVNAKQGCRQQCLSLPHCFGDSVPDQFSTITQLYPRWFLTTEVCGRAWCWGFPFFQSFGPLWVWGPDFVRWLSWGDVNVAEELVYLELLKQVKAVFLVETWSLCLLSLKLP